MTGLGQYEFPRFDCSSLRFERSTTGRQEYEFPRFD